MTFVNQYQEPSIAWIDAGVFLEGRDAYTVAVGHSSNQGVVLKASADGSTVWARDLTLGREELRCFQVLQLESERGLCYMIGATAGRKLFLICLDPAGEQMWLKEVRVENLSSRPLLCANQKGSGAYLTFSDKTEEGANVQVLHVAGSSQVLAQRHLLFPGWNKRALLLTAACAHAEGLTLAGIFDGDPPTGWSAVLSEDLSSSEATTYPGVLPQDLLADSRERCILTGYVPSAERLMLICEEKGNVSEAYWVPDTNLATSLLCFGPDGFYLSTKRRDGSDILFVDANRQIQWRKELRHPDLVIPLTSMAYHRALDCVGFTADVLIGVSGSTFAPCIAHEKPRIEFEGTRIDVRPIKAGLQETTYEFEPVEGKSRTIKPDRIQICKPDRAASDFQLGREHSLQSPHLYLQASGSLGGDSAKGIHLRWLLKGALEKHLPKADYAAANVNFNKPDDYVQVYRAPYVPRLRSVIFSNPPQLINGYEWIYNSAGEAYYLTFIDRVRYDQVKGSIDPGANPVAFLAAYGNGLLELENKSRLAFAIELQFAPVNSTSMVDVELRSVEENTLTAPRFVCLRQRYSTQDINGRRLFGENLRSARFRADQALLTKAVFEFYDDFVTYASEVGHWKLLGKHALTKDDSVAFDRLEPIAGSVHGTWLRYNEGAYVNVKNYKEKWNSNALASANRIRGVVESYILLSDDPANPDASELIYYNDPGAVRPPGFEPSNSQFELSNLQILQLASMDYHVARMLGLGVLDLDPTVMSGPYVYLAEYHTVANLGDGLGPRRLQHLYMSLPTALADQRLPLAVDLKEPVPGITFDRDTEAPFALTDVGGYSHDGRIRYWSLFHEPLPVEPPDAPFFSSNFLFVGADHTLPVYAGIEYRPAGQNKWQKPELAFDAAWLNVDSTVTDDYKQETRSVIIPNPINPVFIHPEKQSGWHDYGSYGINWFSRSTSSGLTWPVESIIQPRNLLLPPTNLNAVLISPEQPLLLTSKDEQVELSNLTATDKTFIRLSWDYNHGQELIDYHRAINGVQVANYVELPDSEELFAEEIKIYFRDTVPNSIGGKILGVANAVNPIMTVITTGEYVFQSQGIDPNTGLPVASIVPNLPSAQEPAFIGGVLSVDGINYTIHSIDNSGQYPKIAVFKTDSNGNTVGLGTTVPLSELKTPELGKFFTAVENLTIPKNWGAANPQALVVKVEPTIIHREEIKVSQPDGTIDIHVHKFRGVFGTALIEAIPEDHDLDEEDGVDLSDTPRKHLGLYRITFNGISLPEHSQAAGPGPRVEFSKGIVRVHSTVAPSGPRKELTVISVENIGTSADLVVYAVDSKFIEDASHDLVLEGTQTANYYPGYRAYLFADISHGLTATTTTPPGNEAVRYTIFGVRCHDLELGYFSQMSAPALMFAQVNRPPLAPHVPVGPLYATRPDYYGKASYTFTTTFDHAPHGVQYLRASDEQILHALYSADPGISGTEWTVRRIKDEVFVSNDDQWFDARWQNLVGLDYTYPSNSALDGLLAEFPTGGASLPMPNSPKFIDAMNDFVDDHNEIFTASVPHVQSVASLHQVVIPGSVDNDELQVKDFLREVIQNCFVPLTEIPIVFEYVKGLDYQPISKKQVVRDRNGVLLSPTHPDFDMAPMAKRIGPDAIAARVLSETQFTDFNIDGASNAHYFYAVREFSLKMQAGPFSPILGPVHLVNTAPPRPPEVVKVTPVLEDRALALSPAIELRINSYPTVQRIKTLDVYRATNSLDAQSVRTMVRLPGIDVIAMVLGADLVWTIRDEFTDLGYVPYGDPLFYVLTVSRAVKYLDRNGAVVEDLVPSQPSKMILTNIVESYNPDAPKLDYYATAVNGNGELEQVTLAWNKKVHNGKYHVFKRNPAGNWLEISLVQDNADRLILPLSSSSLGSGTLPVEDADGKPIYHHFKVVSVNFAGMLSQTEEVLTIHQPALWHDILTL